VRRAADGFCPPPLRSVGALGRAEVGLLVGSSPGGKAVTAGRRPPGGGALTARSVFARESWCCESGHGLAVGVFPRRGWRVAVLLRASCKLGGSPAVDGRGARTGVVPLGCDDGHRGGDLGRGDPWSAGPLHLEWGGPDRDSAASGLPCQGARSESVRVASAGVGRPGIWVGEGLHGALRSRRRLDDVGEDPVVR